MTQHVSPYHRLSNYRARRLIMTAVISCDDSNLCSLAIQLVLSSGGHTVTLLCGGAYKRLTSGLYTIRQLGTIGFCAKGRLVHPARTLCAPPHSSLHSV